MPVSKFGIESRIAGIWKVTNKNVLAHMNFAHDIHRGWKLYWEKALQGQLESQTSL